MLVVAAVVAVLAIVLAGLTTVPVASRSDGGRPGAGVPGRRHDGLYHRPR